MPQDEKLLPQAEEPKLLEAPRRTPPPPPRRKMIFLFGGGLLILLALIFLLGYLPRHKRQKAAEEAARKEALALPEVNVTKVRAAPSLASLLLPATTTPLTEAYIYARASGYVRKRYVDIGDRVRQGQLLADIDAPDLDQQVAQARAAVGQAEQQLQQTQHQLENAQATEELNRVTYERYRVLGEHGAVSRQDVDQQLANYKTAVATVRQQEANVRTNEQNVQAAKANLQRMIDLQSFEQVRAPFTGIITARNFDIGALISGNGAAGGAATVPSGGTQVSGSTDTQGTTGTNISASSPAQGTGGGVGELFRIAQIGVLRILVNVPQDNAPTIRVGQPATVFVQEFAGRTFSGKVTRTSESLDPASRTLLTEVQVANRDNSLLPGMYSQVQFEDHRSHPPLLVPGDSLVVTPQGMQLAVLTDPTREQLEKWRQQQEQQQGQQQTEQPKRIHMQTVQLGRDYGPQIEITAGLAGWEYVVVNPGDFAEEGALVEPHAAPPIAGQGNPQRQGQTEKEPSSISTPSMQAPTQGKQKSGGGGQKGNSKGGWQVKKAAACLLLLPCAWSQPGGHWYSWLEGPYLPRPVPAVYFENSPRLAGLLRAGSLYLSLPDAIALALENNLDVEYERFEPRIAATDTLRAKGGGTLRGISLTVTELPSGVGGPSTPLINTPAGASLPGSTVPTSISELTGITPTSSGIDITGAAGMSAGPPIPPFDPSLTAGLQYQHQNSPQANTFVSGTPSIVGHSFSGNVGVQKGFSTGTLLGLTFDSTEQSTNSTRNSINPYTTSNLGLNLTQPLLRGFGVGVNRRFIRIAKNNQKTTDLVFREQAIATVAGVIRLYYDLVSLMEDVKVKQETLALAERLYQDNSLQVTQGTLAPIELTRAEAQVAAARQDLTNSQGFEEQQELLMKTLLTRRGTADPALRNARIVAVTPIEVPDKEAATPIDDLVNSAFHDRPELEEARLQISNSHINLEGSRNELLPELNVVASAQNTGLAGSPNAQAPSTGQPTSNTGGTGSSISELFTARYPTYTVGLQLVLPLRNRVAQADYERDAMQIRQWEIRYQQLENQVRLEVEGAWLALNRSRGALDAAVQARTLQEKSLAIEMEKFATGLSTTYLVMQYQGMVAQARSTEVAARGVYAKAKAALERAQGATLANHNISFADAVQGKIR